MKFKGINALAVLAALVPATAFAAVSEETAYILNTLLFLVMGVLVMFMAAGFSMLEAGMVRHRSVASIVLKNMALYAVAGLMFFLTGYNLMYSGVDGGYIGTFGLWSADDSAALSGDFSAGYAASSDWFFQMVFVATTVSIVSGAVAERMKIEPFLVFAVLLSGLFYPITGAWQWGGGWLSDMGFSDFAGSTLVHSVGGWAALAGIFILGPRLGRFDADGKPVAMLPSSVSLVGLGVFILWFGWFGFNGGSQLALGSAEDAISVANIFANTNTAAAAGVVAALLLTRLKNGRFSIYDSLNGALGGLVSITAEPLTPTLVEAAVIGAVGGVLVVLASTLLERAKLDDVVGAIPVHLVCGIWGTMAVPITNTDTSFGTQAIGVLAIGAFTLLLSFTAWTLIKAVMGLRLPAEEEAKGLDIAELEVSGYPYFEERAAARS
jgi:Amt family ammonium transporter